MNSCSISFLGLDTQIFGDPEAADVVFSSGADVLAVGINVTRQVIMKGSPFCMFCSSTVINFVQSQITI